MMETVLLAAFLLFPGGADCGVKTQAQGNVTKVKLSFEKI